MIVQNMCNKISFSTLLTLEVSRLGVVLSKIIQATDIISSRTSDTCYVVIILMSVCFVSFPFLFTQWSSNKVQELTFVCGCHHKGDGLARNVQRKLDGYITPLLVTLLSQSVLKKIPSSFIKKPYLCPMSCLTSLWHYSRINTSSNFNHSHKGLGELVSEYT